MMAAGFAILLLACDSQKLWYYFLSNIFQMTDGVFLLKKAN
jgi:hypothetical protein